ncbi:MAG: glycosyltransferase [Candidatus Jordarchaeaceae archaeon]
MTLPFVSVVVITKNNAKTIEKCINNLLDQEYPQEFYEIIFVDGHSSDGTDEIIKGYLKVYPIMKLYYEDYGTIGYARNVGIENSKGDIIAYIDGDAYPPREWLGKIVNAFNSNGKLAIVGGLDILTSGSKVITSSASVVDSWRRLEKKVGIKAIPCIKTVNFAIKRSVALASGGFDQTLSYWEEPELMARIYVRIGMHGILYDPHIHVYHERVPSSGIYRRIRKVFRTSVIGVPVFLRKHMLKVAAANPVSNVATSVYMILACILTIPSLVILIVNGLILSALIILSLAYLAMISFYTLYASMRTKKFAVTLPFILSLDCVARFAGAFFGLMKMLVKYLKQNYAKTFTIFAR